MDSSPCPSFGRGVSFRGERRRRKKAATAARRPRCGKSERMRVSPPGMQAKAAAVAGSKGHAGSEYRRRGFAGRRFPESFSRIVRLRSASAAHRAVATAGSAPFRRSVSPAADTPDDTPHQHCGYDAYRYLLPVHIRTVKRDGRPPMRRSMRPPCCRAPRKAPIGAPPPAGSRRSWRCRGNRTG